MVAVFVHGVPETPAIWLPLIDALDVDQPALLRLPGFGCPLPDGFEPTMDRYASWMADELGGIDGPIDLVVHDWGAILAWRVLAEHHGIARSLVTDGPNLDPEFEWHDMAKVWQTPGDGEAMIDAFVGAPPADRATLLAASGVPADAASAMAESIDATMGAAILTLYRSATDIGDAWGAGIDSIALPALVIDAADDPYRSEQSVSNVAARIGAQRCELAGQGHWWMLGDPAAAAQAISAFWATVDR